MPKELGIREGEYWAYLSGKGAPLRRALVIDPGTHYYALIRIALPDEPDVAQLWVRRAKLPCLWSAAPDYLDQHPEIEADSDPRFGPAETQEGFDDAAFLIHMATTIREEIALAFAAATAEPAYGRDKIAYSVKEAAVLVGCSETSVRNALNDGSLEGSYIGSKALIQRPHLQAWLDALP